MNCREKNLKKIGRKRAFLIYNRIVKFRKKIIKIF